MDNERHEKYPDVHRHTMEPGGNTMLPTGVDLLLPQPTEAYQPPVPGTITVIDPTRLKNLNDILCPDGIEPEVILKILPFEGAYQRVSTTDMRREPVFEAMRNFQPITSKGEVSAALRTFNYILWAIVNKGRFTRTEVLQAVNGSKQAANDLIDEFIKREIIAGKGGSGVRGIEDLSVVPRLQILDLRTAADLIPPPPRSSEQNTTKTTGTAVRYQNRPASGYEVQTSKEMPEKEDDPDDPVQSLLKQESEILKRMVESWGGPTSYRSPGQSITPEELKNKSNIEIIMDFMTGKLGRLPFTLDEVDLSEIYDGYKLASASEHVIKKRARRLEDWMHDKNFYLH